MCPVSSVLLFYLWEERALHSAFELERRRHTSLMAIPNM